MKAILVFFGFMVTTITLSHSSGSVSNAPDKPLPTRVSTFYIPPSLPAYRDAVKQSQLTADMESISNKVSEIYRHLDKVSDSITDLEAKVGERGEHLKAYYAN